MSAAGRRVLVVSPHFPPDSSAGSHRARIIVPHLEKFGWEPVVLTVGAAAIDGRPDPDLLVSIPNHIRVVRAVATPLRCARAAGVGDLGLRALRGLYVEGRRLLATGRFDVVFITTYPIYPAWLGPRFKAASGTPFVLDFQDPWVGAWGLTVGPGGRPDLRSRLSRRVAVALERSIVPQADAIVAVSAGTLEELAARVPSIRTRPLMELPIGWEPSDFIRTAATNRPMDEPQVMRLSYVGTLLPAGHDVVRALLAGALQLQDDLAAPPFHVQFIGTSNQSQHSGEPLMTGLIPPGAEHFVREHPERVPFHDALAALQASDVVLVLGTREPHYTASKLYPALASQRAVLAILHEESQAAGVLHGAAGTALVTFNGATSQAELSARIAAGLREALRVAASAPFDRGSILDAYRGEALAGRLAQLLDRVTAEMRTDALA
jgi:hypothetical protein